MVQKKYKKVCKLCGIEFETVHKQQRYCEAHRDKRLPIKTKVCPACKAEFTPHRGNQKYCSEYCKKKYNEKLSGNYGGTYNMRSYAHYQQTRLAQCVKVARDAGMTYGEAERAGLFAKI